MMSQKSKMQSNRLKAGAVQDCQLSAKGSATVQESIRLPRCPRESPLVFYTNETLKAPKTAFARRAGLENHLSTGRNLSGCKMASPSRLGRSHTTTPSRCKDFKTSMCGKTHSEGRELLNRFFWDANSRRCRTGADLPAAHPQDPAPLQGPAPPPHAPASAARLSPRINFLIIQL